MKALKPITPNHIQWSLDKDGKQYVITVFYLNDERESVSQSFLLNRMLVDAMVKDGEKI